MSAEGIARLKSASTSSPYRRRHCCSVHKFWNVSTPSGLPPCCGCCGGGCRSHRRRSRRHLHRTCVASRELRRRPSTSKRNSSPLARVILTSANSVLRQGAWPARRALRQRLLLLDLPCGLLSARRIPLGHENAEDLWV